MSQKRVPATLVDAVRACAARGLTAVQAAAELKITPGAVSGIAHRNRIKWYANTRGPDRQPRKRRGWQYPVTLCSWSGCQQHTEPGGMFCFEHERKPLIPTGSGTVTTGP